MSPEKKIKLQARNTLAQNNWPVAVAAVLVTLSAVLAVIYLLSGVDLLFTAILDPVIEMLNITNDLGEDISYAGSISGTLTLPLLVMLIPLFMGVVRVFYLMTKNEEVAFSEIFHYIGHRYFRTLGVFFGVFVRCLWQAAVCFLPYYIGLSVLTVSTAEKDKLAFSDNIWYFIVYALLFGGILLFAKLSIRYFLSFFLYFEDESLNAGKLCELSRTYMVRFEGSVMKLIFSLFPWILSCILIIPCLFVLPYAVTCLATSAKWIIALYHQSENKDE